MLFCDQQSTALQSRQRQLQNTLDDPVGCNRPDAVITPKNHLATPHTGHHNCRRPVTIIVAPQVHGGSKHNDAVDQDIQDMKDKGYTDIRKNQAQFDAQGNKVGNNRPDAQGTRPDGQREYREQDTDPNRSVQHGETIKKNDPIGICILGICVK